VPADRCTLLDASRCAAQSFPIKADELIAKAKQLEAAFGGALDDSLLAPDFRFEFPVVSLAREVRLSYGCFCPAAQFAALAAHTHGCVLRTQCNHGSLPHSTSLASRRRACSISAPC